MSLFIDCQGATDAGRVRTNNEDTFLVKFIDDETRVLCMVIDGVGGYEGGEVAAEIAANTVFDYLNENPDGTAITRLKAALNLANNSILDRANAEPKLNRMGCVATAAIIDLETSILSIVHIGDTRLYMYRDGQLTKLTHDHSLVGYREEMGLLTEAEAMNHPNRNLIERCLGSEYHQPDDPNYLDAANYAIDSDCQLLLCSDGLCDMITSQAMMSVLSMHESPIDTAERLIYLANEAGGRDNVTVVIAQIKCPQAAVEDIQDNGTSVAPRRAIASTLAEQAPVATGDNAVSSEQASTTATETGTVSPKATWWRNPRNISMLVCAFIVGIAAGVALATQIRTEREEQAEAEAKATQQRQMTTLRDSINMLQDSIRVLTGNAGDTVGPAVPPVAANGVQAVNREPAANHASTKSNR